MKFTRVAALLVLLCAPVASQDSGEAVRRRVDQALAEELARLRESILQTVRQELGTASSGSADAALGLITEDLLRKHATYLASDELEGRQAGYEGNRKAAVYIAGIMKQAGLKPVGDPGDDGRPGYFQAFRIGKLETKNCLGLLEGSDPALKKEILVVGAHFDHLGIADNDGPPSQRSDRPRGDDKIWNGADDNGSGTSTLLSLVKAFGEGGLRPKRSILFMAFSGEEGGLIGSRFYVTHPIAPIGEHVFMLNLDMVGRNPAKPVLIEGVGSAGPRLRKVVEAAVAATGLKAIVNDQVTLDGGDSDHTPFRTRGVPFAFVFSGLHADYHKVTDHAEKLAYGNMVLVGRTAGRILWTLADAEESLGERRLDFGGAPAPAAPRRALGVMVETLATEEREDLGLAEGETGVRVTHVNDDSVALAAGIETDDVIVSLDGKKLTPGAEYADLPKILNAIKPGTEVEVGVIRNKARKTLKARWVK